MYDTNSPTGNITISCVDTISARKTVADSLGKGFKATFNDMRSSLYWLDFGNSANTGQVVLGTCGKTFQQPDGEVWARTFCNSNTTSNGSICCCEWRIFI